MNKQKISYDYLLRFPRFMSPGRLLKTSRSLVGVSRETLARRMGIDVELLVQYENDKRRIPNMILIQIFMFGLDFWAYRPTNSHSI